MRERVLNARLKYHGYHLPGGICGLEIYDHPKLPPVVVLTELRENTNTSVTNLVEYLAVLATKHLMAHATLWPGVQAWGPEAWAQVVWLERYEREDWQLQERHRVFYPEWSLVTFASYEPVKETLSGKDRRKFGRPSWKYLTPGDAARWIDHLCHAQTAV